MTRTPPQKSNNRSRHTPLPPAAFLLTLSSVSSAGGPADAGRQGRPEGALAAASPVRRRRRQQTPRGASVPGSFLSATSHFASRSLPATAWPAPFLESLRAGVPAGQLDEDAARGADEHGGGALLLGPAQRGRALPVSRAARSRRTRRRCCHASHPLLPAPAARARCRTRAGRWPRSWARRTPRTTRCACR